MGNDLRQQLEFYRDLGIKTLWRREPAVTTLTEQQPRIETPLLITLPSLAPENDSLLKIRADIGDNCRRCRLCEQRNKIVFSDGDEHAKIVFIGEGPGADEDAQGIPFVGRAGQLLTQMIEGTASKEGIPLKRADVYIANVVKCRPPENRMPEKDEVATCSPFLLRQLEVIKPKVIVCLGNVAAQNLLGTNKSISSFRGQWFDLLPDTSRPAP